MEERATYKTRDTNLEYLEEEMRRIELHEGLRLWIRSAYRLKGIKFAMVLVKAWEKTK